MRMKGTPISTASPAAAKPRLLIKPRLWVILFAAACVLLAGSLLRATLLYQATAAQAEQLRAELASEQAEKDRLTRERDYRISPAYIERMARIEYGFIYPGDIRFVAEIEPSDDMYIEADPGYYDEDVVEAVSLLDDQPV